MLRGLWEWISHPKEASGDVLYVHFPCFDGIVSGVLAWDFLENRKDWLIREVQPINYDVKDKWLETTFSRRSAVVDFLYHPQASFWADHHLTTFVTETAERDFEKRKARVPLFYDDNSGSSARLLWRHVGPSLSDPPRYQEMVEWAEKIDSASYSSVYEAIMGDAHALRINFSLMFRETDTKAYCNYLVTQLRAYTLREVAESPQVMLRFEHVKNLVERGLDHLRNRIAMVGSIVAFDVEASKDAVISRYAPYFFYPEADYSLGITRYAQTARITAMRNPWRNFESVPLGTIFSRYGGGGHQRVASIVLSGERVNEVENIADQILSDVRQYNRETPKPAIEAVLT